MSEISLIVINFIVGIGLLLIPFILACVYFFRFLRKSKTSSNISEELDVLDVDIDDNNNSRWDSNRLEFPEIIFIGISPLAGIVFIYGFSHLAQPLAKAYAAPLVILILIAYLCYWLSRLFKNRMSHSLLKIMPIGMYLGIILSVVLQIHFLAPIMFTGTTVVPYLAIPLYAPLPCILYVIRELYRLHTHSKASNPLSIIKVNWNISYILLALVIIGVLQISYTVFTGDSYALLKVFTESKDFLFSKGSIF